MKITEIVIGLSVALFFLYAAITWAAIPTVVISHSTGECVEVLPVGDCGKLPAKYSIQWRQ